MQKEFDHYDPRRDSTPHACNDPNLSPIEFLQAVYRDPLFPMSIRIDAAKALLPFTEPRPASVPSSHIGCTIVIPPLSLEPWSHICSPWPREGDRGSGSADDPTRNHSQNPFSPNITLTRDDDTVAPQNIETTFHPQSFTDYSTPPTPAELQQTPGLNRPALPIRRLLRCRWGRACATQQGGFFVLTIRLHLLNL